MNLHRDLYVTAACFLSGRLVRSPGWLEWYLVAVSRDEHIVWC